jgi:hypothetical protein
MHDYMSIQNYASTARKRHYPAVKYLIAGNSEEFPTKHSEKRNRNLRGVTDLDRVASSFFSRMEKGHGWE